ncbi:hypothetical protein RCL1_008025 [Eukaryota sp. TZLM3-RCL]
MSQVVSTDSTNPAKSRKEAVVIYTLFCFAALIQLVAIQYALDKGTKRQKAIMTMTSGMLMLWVAVLGLIQYHFRHRLRLFLSKFTRKLEPWCLFFLLSIMSFCIKEAVATLLTNTAYLWDLSPIEASITASGNYLVVIKHSFGDFLPIVVAWSILLSKIQFSAFQVLLLHGLHCYLGLSDVFGGSLLSLGSTILVNGLCLYTPAFAAQWPLTRVRVRWFHYVVGILFPFVCHVLFFSLYQLFPFQVLFNGILEGITEGLLDNLTELI